MANQTGQDGKEIALEERAQTGERLFSPSVAKNRAPILAVFRDLMKGATSILEIGSGTGEHGAFISSALPHLRWQPSDPDPVSRNSISAWAETVSENRMANPLDLRADEDGWWTHPDIPNCDGVTSINMIHISPYTATEGLFQGAAALLNPGQKLFLYGPFKRRGQAVESNLRFDADLTRRDPSWGVRDLDDQLQPLGARFALHLDQIVEMPGNNLSVTFEKG